MKGEYIGKLLVLRGLPASGKTTYARELFSQGYKRVNRDDLREMIDCGVYRPDYEVLIREARDKIITMALRFWNVVVDDTNLKRSDIAYYRSFAEGLGVKLEIKFIDTPLEECIHRDSLRAKPVGEERIREMWKRYLEEGGL